MRRANCCFSTLASVPTISRASASTSSDKNGSEETGKLNAWRSAFRVACERPRAVFGPVLARALARLALILRSLVTRRSLLPPASSRPLRTRLQLLAPAAAAPHSARHDADRSHGAWRRGGSRRSWSPKRLFDLARGLQRLTGGHHISTL